MKTYTEDNVNCSISNENFLKGFWKKDASLDKPCDSRVLVLKQKTMFLVLYYIFI